MIPPEDETEEIERIYAVRPNKSALKRENAELEKLGEELIALPPDRLNKLELPAELLEAVELARAIERHHGAFRRQRKFVARLLREMDVSPIREKLERHGRQSAQETYRLHQIEGWRDRLLAGDEHDLNALVGERPDIDRQKLRQLIRDARKEHSLQAPPRSARLLFKYLREFLEGDEEGGVIDRDD